MSEIKPYISDSVEVTSTTPFSLEIKDTLGEYANVGWISSDDGEIFVQINDRGALKVPLQADDTLEFIKEEDWILKNVYITTTSVSSLTVRYLFKKAGGKV